MNPIHARCIVSPIQGRDRLCSLEGPSGRYAIFFNAAPDAKVERISNDRVDGPCGDYVRSTWADAEKRIGCRALFYGSVRMQGRVAMHSLELLQPSLYQVPLRGVYLTSIVLPLWGRFGGPLSFFRASILVSRGPLRGPAVSGNAQGFLYAVGPRKGRLTAIRSRSGKGLRARKNRAGKRLIATRASLVSHFLFDLNYIKLRYEINFL